MVSRLLNAVLYTLRRRAESLHGVSLQKSSHGPSLGLAEPPGCAERFDPPVSLLRWPALCGIRRGRHLFRPPEQSPGLYLSYYSPLFVIRRTEEAFNSALVR